MSQGQFTFMVICGVIVVSGSIARMVISGANALSVFVIVAAVGAIALAAGKRAEKTHPKR